MSSIYTEAFNVISWHTPSASRICQNEFRLDASFFANSAEHARAALVSSGMPTKRLSELASVFALSDFSLARIPAAEDRGVPFFTFSDILEWDAQPTTFLSTKYELNLDDYKVQEGWVLLSRAGTIGNAIIVGPELVGKAVANHAIRIVPKGRDTGSLLYLILTGSIGRTVISSLMYGSVVDVIKPAQLQDLAIPVPPASVLHRISEAIAGSLAARSESLRMLRASCELVHKANSLLPLPRQTTFSEQGQLQPSTFRISAQDVSGNATHGCEYRLDGHFYNPTAQLAVANIKKCLRGVKTVGDVAERVLMGPRFKRNYVEATHGVPFLSGKNIGQIRPTDLKYLSNLQMADMQELLVNREWTLITCSGTIGRTCFVWKNYEDYAASQHILRVIPDKSNIDPGYLYAFLSSRYGYEQILRYRHGSVIDEITDTQIKQVLVPCPSRKEQTAIGDKVREAYEKRAEAIRLEDEAQAILMKELTKAPGTKGA